MTQEGKDLFQSKTTWGILIAVADQVLQQFGIQLSDLVDIGQITNSIPEMVGIILAIYGNLTRKAPITSVAGKSINQGAK